MRALVKTAPGTGHVGLVDDWPDPRPAPGWVVVEVIACGLCGTDLHILHDEHKNWPPVVLGHEYVGRIARLGEDVEGFAVGDRVVCEQHTLACGRCDVCRRGAIHLCSHKRSPGWGIDGAFADRVALPAALLHRVPDSVADLAAVTTEPSAICLTGIDRLDLRAGERVAVVGPGPIGLVSALLARHAGAAEVFVVGRSSSAHRIAAAERFGFTTVVSDRVDAVTTILAATGGLGVDAVIETSGAAAALDTAIRVCRSLGRIVCLGIGGQGVDQAGLAEAMTRSLSIHFSMSSEYSTWDRALRLMAAGYDPSPLVRSYPLADWSEAFDDVAARRVIKAVIVPGRAQ
ncbi:alcohol dehydrogenase catalytic domain-containing protein [Frankia sp. Cppng1_Ct_nod]|uniref:zinc-dependent alcohol dehydrogenase n=1 Tax=Frankia sp. Cppng1_Ct_nod TaxID=2897162 RepID=UPI001041A9AF|nr:alcohol dehydrogenase catalytic domain-containing protein [Frankia sp. Cppng1_Ct_nod]